MPDRRIRGGGLTTSVSLTPSARFCGGVLLLVDVGLHRENEKINKSTNTVCGT